MLTLWMFVFAAMDSSMAADSGSSATQEYIPVTLDAPDIPPDELSLLVKPLTAAELEVEADAWLLFLRDKTFETSQAELAIRQKNRTIEKAEEVQEALVDTRQMLEDVRGSAKLEMYHR